MQVSGKRHQRSRVLQEAGGRPGRWAQRARVPRDGEGGATGSFSPGVHQRRRALPSRGKTPGAESRESSVFVCVHAAVVCVVVVGDVDRDIVVAVAVVVVAFADDNDDNGDDDEDDDDNVGYK